MHKIGDIIKLYSTGEKKLIVDYRDEIIPVSNNWNFSLTSYRMRTVYRVAGTDYSNHWFSEKEIASSIPKR